MTNVRIAALVLCLLPAAAGAETASGRNPTPERVSIVAGVGLLEPIGRFGDHVDGGATFDFAGFYRLNQWVAPAFALRYGLLEPSDRGSLDTWSALGGIRVFLLPRSMPVRPWLTALAGWAHYAASPRRIDLAPVIAPRRDDRDDVMLSLGGGADVRLHPNFEIGVDVRHNVSFTDDRETGERDLEAVSVLGTVTFNY